MTASMVRAVLSGRKTQTRRLASSPVAKFEVGDRLYVREAFRVSMVHDETRPSALLPKSMTVFFEAGGSIANNDAGEWRPDAWPDFVSKRPEWAGKLHNAFHMPRWMSRLTLTVTEVRFQNLHDITRQDAVAEGLLDTTAGEMRSMEARNEEGEPVCPAEWADDLVLWAAGLDDEEAHLYADPRQAFFELWTYLHPEHPEENPEIVAITFSVELGNIDEVGA
jgi:hypothetical protein